MDNGLMEPIDQITIGTYPQLRLIAWNRRADDQISAAEALDLYEANWRHVVVDDLEPRERNLIDRLVTEYGRGVLHV